jgi:hypothetical protein
LYYVCNGEKNKNKKTKKMLPDILEMLLEILDRISGKVCSDITSQLPINEASKFGFLIFGTQESHSIHKPILTPPNLIKLFISHTFHPQEYIQSGRKRHFYVSDVSIIVVSQH